MPSSSMHVACNESVNANFLSRKFRGGLDPKTISIVAPQDDGEIRDQGGLPSIRGGILVPHIREASVGLVNHFCHGSTYGYLLPDKVSCGSGGDRFPRGCRKTR